MTIARLLAGLALAAAAFGAGVTAHADNWDDGSGVGGGGYYEPIGAPIDAGIEIGGGLTGGQGTGCCEGNPGGETP